MKRREFISLFGSVAAASPFLWPFPRPLLAQAQNQTTPDQAVDNQIGQVATVQGNATVMRPNATAAVALQPNNPIFKNDTLQTGANSTLGVTFDDETTFSLNANTRIVVDDFVYQDGGKGNSALFTVARGTAAFVAAKVASTGDMKIATPIATMGIRGTTGVIDVPERAAAGAAAEEPRIKLYADADGHVGRIEVFDRQGGRLGALTQGESAFFLRPGAGGRLTAVPFQIPPQEAARDRGVLQRLFVAHAIGRQMTIRRRQQRERNRQQRNNPRQPGGQHPQNFQRRPGGPNARQPGPPRPQSRKPNPSGRKPNH